MFNAGILEEKLKHMQQASPLVHCLTNDVVNNFTANVLLAVGATPAMVIAKEEVAEFAAMASSLLINVGTLHATQAQAMQLAVKSAYTNHKPWVLDPVAFGAINYRSAFCLSLLPFKPAVIRGNASEVFALYKALGGKRVLAHEGSQSKGPDSTLSSTDVMGCAQELAQKLDTVVALTGEVDYVTNGHHTYALQNGHAWLTRVTGTGCALSAMVAAYCAVCETPMQAALSALSHMAIAGEVAHELTMGEGQGAQKIEKGKRGVGIGSFSVALLDQLQLLAQDEAGIKRLMCQELICT